MVDSLRHHYLKTLGITEYIPRDFVDDSEEITQPSQSQPLTETRTAAISQLLADHSEAPKVKVVEKPPVASIEIVSNTETSSIETASVISDSAEVQIGLWQPADKLLVCSAVENELPSPISSSPWTRAAVCYRNSRSLSGRRSPICKAE